jgi:hypothetical protein
MASDPFCFDSLDPSIYRVFFRFDASDSVWAEEIERAGVMQQAELGTAVVEQEAVFRAAGKHSIRFVGSLGYKVVDQDADVTLVPLDDQGLPCPALLHSVDSGD